MGISPAIIMDMDTRKIEKNIISIMANESNRTPRRLAADQRGVRGQRLGEGSAQALVMLWCGLFIWRGRMSDVRLSFVVSTRVQRALYLRSHLSSVRGVV
jgi:hypothetical protein